MDIGQRKHRSYSEAMHWLLSLLLLLVVTSVVAMPSSQVKKLAEVRDELLQALQYQSNDTGDTARILLTTLWQGRQSRESQRDMARHPNGVYHLMKFYLAQSLKWKPSSAVGRRMAGLRSILPSYDNFKAAKQSLIRLQQTYHLNVIDMYAGDYLGHRGPPLTPPDAIQFGMQAFTAHDLELCRQWLDLAEEKMREQKDDSDVSRLAFTLAMLSRVYNMLNQTERARDLYNESFALDPDAFDFDALRKELSGEISHFVNTTEYQTSSELNKLCSRDKEHRVSEVLPYHVCRYKATPHVPYALHKEEILSHRPYVSLFYDMMTPAEVVHEASNSVRTADSCWIQDDVPVARAVSLKVKAATGLEVMPDVGSLIYYTDIQQPSSESLQLNDAEKGHTVFPHLGISVAPLKGMALFWYNFEPDMNEIQWLTIHAGCPVLYGNKWIVNKWILSHGNMFRRPCGTTPNALQADIEQLLQARDAAANIQAFHSD
ncbi:hypothetical protein BaRGS_00030613 [Batillaria attramentaria]|uniref:Prolyl 4-hydroxylase alpha subunit domain-containing protein n=1 Tax=Batillaria attramentaria TaxID=370345 RepID=A0ABD0JTR6_9CAEN